MCSSKHPIAVTALTISVLVDVELVANKERSHGRVHAFLFVSRVYDLILGILRSDSFACLILDRKSNLHLGVLRNYHLLLHIRKLCHDLRHRNIRTLIREPRTAVSVHNTNLHLHRYSFLWDHVHVLRSGRSNASARKRRRNIRPKVPVPHTRQKREQKLLCKSRQETERSMLNA